ncbi:MAG: YbhB/YbcL family Raf kinase inhibitor-like protein [Bacteroidota bacterium]|nr:YbhB/YbcL family Raf kinase inhibitor-like protein [Bacteroidota bacterium]MDP4251444.1 YbhB/YbcL family Raf kinase inhibitor-like protein [Bacteroidota bacterium]
MKKVWLTLTWFVLVISLVKAQSMAAALVLSTTAFEDGGIIPVKYSQAAEGAAPGGGTSPALTWTNVPAGTKSFVLHMHDLDFVHDKTMDDQVHWLVWNIPADKTGLPEGIPKGAQLRDGSYQISVTGPLYRGPGAGANGPLHHYIVELFALDTTLDVKPASDAFQTRAMVMKGMQGHILGRSAYTGRFRRPQ